jgi:hypothetical protein
MTVMLSLLVARVDDAFPCEAEFLVELHVFLFAEETDLITSLPPPFVLQDLNHTPAQSLSPHCLASYDVLDLADGDSGPQAD